MCLNEGWICLSIQQLTHNQYIPAGPLMLLLKKDSQSGLMFLPPLALQGICIHSTQDYPHLQGLLAALVSCVTGRYLGRCIITKNAHLSVGSFGVFRELEPM